LVRDDSAITPPPAKGSATTKCWPSSVDAQSRSASVTDRVRRAHQRYKLMTGRWRSLLRASARAAVLAALASSVTSTLRRGDLTVITVTRPRLIAPVGSPRPSVLRPWSASAQHQLRSTNIPEARSCSRNTTNRSHCPGVSSTPASTWPPRRPQDVRLAVPR
jgi:hypothetical protein